jgi:aldehyde dehydrogenase (NAD+)
MGASGGRTGFETFSHLRSIVSRSTRFDPSLRYPPYSEKKLRWLKRLM